MINEPLKLNELWDMNDSELYEELPVGIAICDSDGRVTDCNEYYLGILGVTRDAILGYNIFDSYNFTDEVMDKIRTSSCYQYDVLYTMPKDVFTNASVDTISISVKIVRRTEADLTIGYIIYLTNHTNEWKRYEVQLDEQDRRYRDLVDNLPLNYTHTKLIFDDNNQIVDYLNMSGNKSCEDFYTEHNMTWGTTLASKFLPETGHIIIGKLNELRNSGATGGHFTYETTEVDEIYEMVVVFEGEDWVNLISIPITTLEQEKREAENRLNEELVNRQAIELKSKQSEARYNKMREEQLAIFDALSDSYSNVYIIDTNAETLRVLKLNGYITTGVNSDKEKIYPYTEVKNQYVSERVHPDDKDMMMEAIGLDSVRSALMDANEYTGNYRVLSEDETHYYQYKYIKLKSLGYVIAGFQNVDNIIEEQKEYQNQLTQALLAAQQANKAKSTFLNNMSHDIRTPMNAIIGFTALAQTHIEEQAQVQDYLAKISTSSTHLLSLINDILDMSRIESGTVKLDEKAVHIPELLHDLRTMIQGLVNSKNLNLFIDTQDVVHEDVLTDKLRLNQVLLNIVGNAIKFTQPGGDIIIRLIEKPCRNSHYTTYEFSVKDNGIGMSEEFLEHIFDTFTREYSATVSGVQGTGLGMAITKNIVDMMGGEITVESEEGKGSLFTVTLDLRITDEQVKNDPIPELLGARALVVDDDLNTCRSVSKMLRGIDMRADWTTSGKEAIVRAQDAAEMQDEYKVYIIDYLMPDMNGIETVRRIRRVISEDVPIIVLTAYDWEDFEYEARDAGVTAFVSKPIFMSELRNVLTQPVISEGITKEKSAEVYDYSGKRVLLVEDNELNREIATAILEETGMTIDSVSDGDVAVSTINGAPADKYDLILMDIQMPKMDGYTATREIRTLPDNKKANIPIVAMTANAFEEDKHQAYAAGMNGHIIKPINVADIAKVLDKIFDEKK